MKTLFVTVDAAFPPISGADLRSWQNARAASVLGPVLLLSIGPPRPEIPPSGIKIDRLSGMEPSAVWRNDFDVTYSAEVVNRLRSVAADFQPDVIVLESLPLTNLANFVRSFTRALVIDLHNIESDLVAQMIPISRDSERRRAIEDRAKRIHSIERRAAALADALWVCSSTDRDRLLRDGFPANRIFVVPNGVPRPNSIQNRPPNNERRVRPMLLFLGHLSYPPNVEAALALLGLMPVLWNRIAGARLVLAGRNPHPAILRRFQPGRIDIIANPASISSHLLAADLAVMPLQRGGGTRIKVLEAMAWGLPIVATARAVEGLHLENGIHVSIAETTDEFVTAICELCQDDARYQSQRLAGRQHVMTNFGPELIQAAVHAGLRFAMAAA